MSISKRGITKNKQFIQRDNSSLNNVYMFKEGTNIEIDDSMEHKIEGVEFDAVDTTQETTTQNANLCPPPTDSRWVFTGGAGATSDGSLSIPVNGSAEITMPWNQSNKVYARSILVSGGKMYFGTTYYDANMNRLNGNGHAYAGADNTQDTWSAGGSDVYGQALSQAYYVKFRFAYSANYAPNAFVVKNIIVSSTNIAYEPFTPDSPSPQYEQPINVVAKRQVIVAHNKNYITNSKEFNSQDYFAPGNSTLLDDTYNGCKIRYLNTLELETSTMKSMAQWSNVQTSLKLPVERGEYYTLSFWAKGSRTSTPGPLQCFFYGDSGYAGAKVVASSTGYTGIAFSDGNWSFGQDLTSEWKRFWVTWQVDTGASDTKLQIPKHILIRQYGNNELYVCGVMLEKGQTPDYDYIDYEQQEYEINLGKNLYDSSFRNSGGNIMTSRGTTSESDGVFTLNATGADVYVWNVLSQGVDYNRYVDNVGPLFKFEKDSYYVSFTTSNINNVYITYYDKDKISLGYKSTAGIINKSDKTGAEYFTIRFGKGNSVAGESFSFSIQLEEGKTRTGNAKYFTPIELIRYEYGTDTSTYSNKIKKSKGYNLFNITDYNNIAFNKNSNTETITKYINNVEIACTTTNYSGAYISKNVISTYIQNYKSGKKYYISFYVLIRTAGNYFFGQGDIKWQNYGARWYRISYEIDFDKALLFISNGINNKITISRIQITTDNIEKEYEPFGKIWYIEKNCDTLLLDGDETPQLYTGSTNTLRMLYTNILPYTSMGGAQGLCNRLIKKTMWSTDEEGFYFDTNSRSVIIRINKSLVGTSVSTLNAWLKNNNLKFYYKLYTPAYEEITNENLIAQLDALENMMTYQGKTLIEVTGDLAGSLNMKIISMYKRLEYIKGTGSQYINIEYIPKSNTKIIIDFENTSDGKWIIGSRTAYQSTDSIGIHWSNSNIYSIVSPASRDISMNASGRHKLELTSTEFKVDDITKLTYSSTLVNGTYPIYIFTMNSGGAIDGRIGVGNLYYCKIYEGNTLVRDLIPVVRITDNSMGLYDNITKSFYENIGSGSFTGKELNITSKIDSNNILYANDFYEL